MANVDRLRILLRDFRGRSAQILLNLKQGEASEGDISDGIALLQALIAPKVAGARIDRFYSASGDLGAAGSYGTTDDELIFKMISDAGPGGSLPTVPLLGPKAAILGGDTVGVDFSRSDVQAFLVWVAMKCCDATGNGFTGVYAGYRN